MLACPATPAIRTCSLRHSECAGVAPLGLPGCACTNTAVSIDPAHIGGLTPPFPARFCSQARRGSSFRPSPPAPCWRLSGSLSPRQLCGSWWQQQLSSRCSWERSSRGGAGGARWRGSGCRGSGGAPPTRGHGAGHAHGELPKKRHVRMLEAVCSLCVLLQRLQTWHAAV